MPENDPFKSNDHRSIPQLELDCGVGLRLLRVSDGHQDPRTFEFASERGVLIVLLYSGSAHLQLGADQSCSMNEGDKLWTANLQQGCRLTMAPGAVYDLIKIALSGLERVATGQGAPVRTFAACGEHPSDAVLENFVDALSEHAIAVPVDRGIDPYFCRAVATAIEHHVLRTYIGLNSSLLDVGGALASWQLQAVKEAILANLETKLQVHELAHMCGISISHFRRAFFSSTGMSLHRWVIRQRIEQVCGDLLSSPLPIADIALRWGFSDQSHLSRTFVAVLGMTPTKWRKTHAEQTFTLKKPRSQRSCDQEQDMPVEC